jgi:uracil-DNA glycosylase
MNKKEHKQWLLDQLYEPYKKCLECPLGFLGRKTVVFGEGNPDARLMIIGEGPGREEDEHGRPFIGRSGKFLTKVLHELGVDRKDIFITNIVKCRPPNNRNPLPLEMKTCKDLLLANQIKIIQPHVICTLGSSALEGLLDKKITMNTTRGTVLYFNEILIIPTYHPAFIMRFAQNTTFFIQDIEKALNFSKR